MSGWHRQLFNCAICGLLFCTQEIFNFRDLNASKIIWLFFTELCHQILHLLLPVNAFKINANSLFGDYSILLLKFQYAIPKCLSCSCNLCGHFSTQNSVLDGILITHKRLYTNSNSFLKAKQEFMFACVLEMLYQFTDKL